MIISEMRKIYAVILFFGCRGLFRVGSEMKKRKTLVESFFSIGFFFLMKDFFSIGSFFLMKRFGLCFFVVFQVEVDDGFDAFLPEVYWHVFVGGVDGV